MSFDIINIESSGGPSNLAIYNKGTTLNPIGSGTVRIDFNSVVSDVDSLVTTGGSWVYTAPEAGIYWVSVHIAPTGDINNNASYFLTAKKNGSTIVAEYRFQGENTQTNFDVTLNCEGVIDLAQNDTIQADVSGFDGSWILPNVGQIKIVQLDG